ncbi:MAG: TonB-dependent receptor [Rhodospirillaceae bacterium]|nr:TonB-dependent receptor [Rhodospirillaceae bacterium]
MKTYFARLSLVGALLLAPTPAAWAQDPAQDASGRVERQVAPGVTEINDNSSTRTIYSQEFFAAYSPITAKDMLEHVPGVVGVTTIAAQNLKEDRRGLRSNTDQILINGKRVTGKDGDSQAYLEKLPSTRILRIEVILGNVKELDAEVGVRVINLVTDDTKKSSGSFGIGLIEFSTGNSRPNFQLNYGGEAGALTYTLALETRPRMLPADLEESVSSPAAPIGVIRELRAPERRNYNARALLTYDFGDGQVMQMNALVDHISREENDTLRTLVLSPTGGETLVGAILDHGTGRDTIYEISGDYVQPFGDGNKFLGLLVHNQTVNKLDSDLSNVLGLSPVATGGDTLDQKSDETILRGTFRFPMRTADEFEIGVEGARNKLDKDLDFFSVVGGRRVDIAVFNSDQVVSEDRVEVFSTYSWKLSDNVEVEPGVAAEFSWLDQVGTNVNSNRSFKFAKPTLNVVYTPSGTSQVFLNVARDVGQLSFEDFTATVDRDADEIIGGNPLLVPEKSWDFNVGFDHRFANGAGTINLKGFYRRIQDVNDRVPLAAGQSGPGNIGDGKNWGGKVEGSAKFAKLGLPDITLSGSFLWQTSSVTDPFTKAKRRIAKEPRYEISGQGRHDLRRWNLSYGFEYNKKGPTVESDFNKFDVKTTGGDLRLFVEKQVGNGLIVRFFTGNSLKLTNTRERTLYVVSQADGRILQRQFRVERQAYFLGLRLRGTF